MIAIEKDAIVVGGGLAGICSALSLARCGKSVGLVTNRQVLGGNSSSEIRVWTRGASGAGNLFSEEMGILGELKLYNEFINPKGKHIFWDEVLLDTVLQEKNIDLYLSTFITDIDLNDSSEITSVSGYEIISENKYLFKAKHFVDATGDGTIGAKAGVPFVIGDDNVTLKFEDKDKYKTNTQGNTILFYAKDIGESVPFIAPKYIYPIEYIEKLLNNGGRIVNETSNGCDLWWVEVGGHSDTINEYKEINLENKKLILGVFNYIKNSGKYNAENLELQWVGSMGGKRESRRFKTEYVLKGQDIFTNKSFSDVGFYGGWYMDFHPSAGIYSSESFCTQKPVYIYEMPFGCLYSKHCKNLFFAGRNIGVDSSVFASSRVMNTCALSGQAVGTLISVLIDKHKNNNQIDNETINDAQQILRDNDMFLLEKAFNKNSLLNDSEIITEDTIKTAFDKRESKLNLQNDIYLALETNLAKTAKLIVNAKAKTEVEVQVYHSPLPHRFKFENALSTNKVQLVEGENFIDLKSIGIENLTDYITFVFKANELVDVFTSSNGAVGVVMGYCNQVKMYFPNLIVENLDCYNVQNLVNGFNRPYKKCNAWVSDKENAKLKIVFKEKQSIKQLQFAFNPELSIDLLSSRMEKANPHHLIDFRNGVCPNLVKDFNVYIVKAGEKKLVSCVKNNYQRIVKVDVSACEVEAIIVDFIKTNGANSIEVFEIRKI